QRFRALLFGICAGLALVLSLIGVYGVVSYAVSQRTPEIGIRMALGADRGAVIRIIMLDAVRLLAWGATFGVLGALVVARVLPFLLYRVSAADPTVIGGIATLLALVGLLASWLPARRATGVDPMTALRCD
ncbi:MAG: FtsX-like permease family protein, partial [Gemmatimonadaceae bacterium]